MAPESSELLWGGRSTPARGPKPGLSLERIVAEAVALADAEGLEKLSMKRLAERLDSGVMSLYRYVPNKDELVTLMMDASVGTPPDIPGDLPWRDAARRCAWSMRELFRAHPWTLPLTIQPREIGPNETAWVEAQLTALSALPVPAATAMRLMLLLSGYVRSSVSVEVSMSGSEQLRFGVVDHPETHGRYPRLLRTLAEWGDAPDDAEADFAFGLERVLDGIAASGGDPDGRGSTARPAALAHRAGREAVSARAQHGAPPRARRVVRRRRSASV